MREQLKIAMLSIHSCPIGRLGGKDTGGMNVYIRELARELGRLGHSVDIYTRAHDPLDDQIIDLGDGTRLIHLQVGEVKDIDKLMVYPHLSEFACNLENFRKRNGLDYDLIHSHYWLSGWVGRCVQAWWNVPHITMFHTLGAVKNAIGVGEDAPELRVETEKILTRNCQCIIAATEKEKEDLIHYYGASVEKISVIPCGVNLELFQPVDKQLARRKLGMNGGNIILFVGRIEPLKGIDRLLDAMTHLRNGKRATLVVVGGDDHSQPEVKRLQRLSRELDIQDSVIFAGTVRQEDLAGYYSAADVCVIPSFYESFGLVVLESLACGTPVVATDVGCAGSVIHQGRTGYVVKDNATVCLADGIAELISRSNNGVETVKSTRATVAGFGWANIAKAVVGHYNSVLANKTGMAG